MRHLNRVAGTTVNFVKLNIQLVNSKYITIHKPNVTLLGPAKEKNGLNGKVVFLCLFIC